MVLFTDTHSLCFPVTSRLSVPQPRSPSSVIVLPKYLKRRVKSEEVSLRPVSTRRCLLVASSRLKVPRGPFCKPGSDSSSKQTIFDVLCSAQGVLATAPPTGGSWYYTFCFKPTTVYFKSLFYCYYDLFVIISRSGVKQQYNILFNPIRNFKNSILKISGW